MGIANQCFLCSFIIYPTSTKSIGAREKLKQKMASALNTSTKVDIPANQPLLIYINCTI